jgi:tetratricopeptide (TPR) repeat protein
VNTNNASRRVLEASYLEKELKDDKRYYLASHEAMSLSNNIEVLLSAGWASFKCGRIKEAIDITNKAVDNSKNDELQFTININLGLFHYWKTFDKSSNKIGSRYYDRAFEILKAIAPTSQEESIHAAIDDIEIYSDNLNDAVIPYLEKFRSMLA